MGFLTVEFSSKYYPYYFMLNNINKEIVMWCTNISNGAIFKVKKPTSSVGFL